jgi:N6-L-threonylcarbamoyladenine synthase
VSKVRKALEATGAKSFLIGGGVAANTHIRRELTKLIESDFPETKIYLPHISITGDNAVMIAQATLMHLMNGEQPRGGDIRAGGNLSL